MSQLLIIFDETSENITTKANFSSDHGLIKFKEYFPYKAKKILCTPMSKVAQLIAYTIEGHQIVKCPDMDLQKIVWALLLRIWRPNWAHGAGHTTHTT